MQRTLRKRRENFLIKTPRLSAPLRLNKNLNMHENEISEKIIGAAIEVHKFFGPGLVEQIYEESLCHEFNLRGIRFER